LNTSERRARAPSAACTTRAKGPRSLHSPVFSFSPGLGVDELDAADIVLVEDEIEEMAKVVVDATRVRRDVAVDVSERVAMSTVGQWWHCATSLAVIA
jgi:hypothetical protein